jgi:ketosteroid isomerase-like protein
MLDVVSRWHDFVQRPDPLTLDRLLDEDVVFFSPVVFTPQRGKAVTKAYLLAAATALAGDGAFRYTKEIVGDRAAALEFETTVNGKHVNGVDLLTAGDTGRITEFRVMIRPLQALDAVHRRMGEMLAAAQP